MKAPTCFPRRRSCPSSRNKTLTPAKILQLTEGTIDSKSYKRRRQRDTPIRSHVIMNDLLYHIQPSFTPNAPSTPQLVVPANKGPALAREVHCSLRSASNPPHWVGKAAIRGLLA